MTTTQDPLFDPGELENAKAQLRVVRAHARALGAGPVYQGVSKQIRWLTASGAEGTDADGNPREPVIDADTYAGVIAATRAVARALDKATGHNLTGYHANGRDLAPIAERLESLLRVLMGDDVEVDEFQELLDKMDALPAPRAEHPHG